MSIASRDVHSPWDGRQALHITTLNLSLPIISKLVLLRLSLGYTMAKSIALFSLFNRLPVGQKIGTCYAIALGVAIGGTGLGFWVSDHYQQWAWQAEEHARTEIELLHRLQTAVLQTRTHQQQLIPLAAHPTDLKVEYEHLITHITTLDKAWTDVQNFSQHSIAQNSTHAHAIPQMLMQYQGVPQTYAQMLKATIQPILTSETISSTEAAMLQRQLLAFTNSEIALQFDGISDDLTDLVLDAHQENLAAEAISEDVESLRLKIIAVSMLSAIGVACGLLAVLHRAIAQPLKSVTDVAQQVIHYADFDLQARVTSEDEIGVLTQTLNNLIRQVNQLLTEQERTTQEQLIQSEKMSSLGQMLAGVAHEINNPINFIYGNLSYAEDYLQSVFKIIAAYEQVLPNPPQSVQEQIDELDWDFLQADLPRLLQSIKLGAERTRQIVFSLKSFSRLDEAKPHAVDIHSCLDSTLLILQNRTKQGISVVKHYGNIPAIEGYAGSLYQVFMNILSNAIDALTESDQGKKVITITTQRLEKHQVQIAIADNGPGIPLDIQTRIFDVFFTTKPAGIGTGLGLAISYKIITEKHAGSLDLKSVPGEGAEFTITLPIYSLELRSHSEKIRI